ncbi:MAG TPA: DUF3160 domain-containing protein, partial [Chroococcales cyanobacterium]
LLFLIAAAKAAADDYKNADDKEVRSDVEHNLAFLSVAIRLLDPKAQVQTPGQSSLMADAEMKTLQHGLHAHSNIFNDTYNYTALRSSGWRAATEKLKNFHLCYNWLSRSSFQLNESETSGDAFRRSALLYSEIERSSVGSQPALAVWKKIEAGMRLIGCPAFTGERTLFLPDFDTVFKSRGPEAKLSLSGLADPFYRTKLLLNVRRQKPVETTAKSIFELSSNRKSQDGGAVVFRLFTPMEEPESVWMRTEAPSQEAQGPEVPIALLALRARGAQQASNLLGENIFKLEPALANSVPNLIRLVKQESAAGGTQNWPWSLFGNYLKPAQEHLQIPFKTRLWMNKRLETTFAAWVDSHVALWKPQSGQVKPGPGESGSKSSGSAGTAGSPPSATAGGAAVNFHYLEPAPDVFHQMRLQLQHQMEALEKLGYFSSDGKSQTDDFIRLLQRFETIAVREVSAQPMFSADVSLLANIDSVLEPISTAVTANMWLGTSPKLGEGESGSGVAMGLGRPGELLILLRSYRGLVLLRGASYTYYEMPGPPINVVHWNRKLEYGFLHSPFWTGDFDLPMDGLLSAPVNPASP